MMGGEAAWRSSAVEIPSKGETWLESVMVHQQSKTVVRMVSPERRERPCGGALPLRRISLGDEEDKHDVVLRSVIFTVA